MENINNSKVKELTILKLNSIEPSNNNCKTKLTVRDLVVIVVGMVGWGKLALKELLKKDQAILLVSELVSNAHLKYKGIRAPLNQKINR